MNRTASILATLTVSCAALAVPATAAAAAAAPEATDRQCASTRPGNDYYAGGRIASNPMTVPKSACTTISVSHIRDVRNPADRCQTFLVELLSASGERTYTEPVEACSEKPRRRTVLATDVPDGTVFRVIYQVDYIEPESQTVRYTVWR